MGRFKGLAVALIGLTILIMSASGGKVVHAQSSTPYYTFLGDSLTAGFYASADADTFPNQILTATGVQGTILGEPGTTAVTIMPYVAQIPSQSTVVFVEIGTNDLPNYTNSQFQTNYDALITAIKTQAPNALLWCLSPWQDPGTDYSAGGSIMAYNAIIQHACNGNFINIDQYYNGSGGTATRGPAGVSTPFGTSDDFHPNDYGHSQIAGAIANALVWNNWGNV